MPTNTIISAVGSYLPKKIMPNSAFENNTFYKKDGEKIEKEGSAVLAKLEQISGIRERRFIEDDHDTVELAALAGTKALEDAGMTGEELDGIIVAHDVGNLVHGTPFANTVPNLAAIVKKRLNISNHKCSAFDIMFGCPGWLEGVILAHQRIQCGMANHILVIGVEVVSRRMDPHDLDSMLFGDGAGATVISADKSSEGRGILYAETWSHCNTDETEYIKLGPSNNEEFRDGLYVKMLGRMVYRYATTKVPDLILTCLDKANLKVADVDKFVLHQANEKMLIVMGQRLFGNDVDPKILEEKIPMTLHTLGNTSVATIPTLLDLMDKGKQGNHKINEGDLVVMASVGAGMHANCVIYRA